MAIKLLGRPRGSCCNIRHVDRGGNGFRCTSTTVHFHPARRGLFQQTGDQLVKHQFSFHRPCVGLGVERQGALRRHQLDSDQRDPRSAHRHSQVWVGTCAHGPRRVCRHSAPPRIGQELDRDERDIQPVDAHSRSGGRCKSSELVSVVCVCWHLRRRARESVCTCVCACACWLGTSLNQHHW